MLTYFNSLVLIYFNLSSSLCVANISNISSDQIYPIRKVQMYHIIRYTQSEYFFIRMHLLTLIGKWSKRVISTKLIFEQKVLFDQIKFRTKKVLFDQTNFRTKMFVPYHFSRPLLRLLTGLLVIVILLLFFMVILVVPVAAVTRA